MKGRPKALWRVWWVMAASAPVPPWAMKVVLDETFVLEEEPL